MNEHAAVRAGEEEPTLALLTRLARQAAGIRYPPPDGYDRWTADAVRDLVCDTFARKGPQFLAAAVTSTTTDAQLERYLLRVFENVLRDQARETERGKLIARLKTILGAEQDFAHHTDPYNSWRLISSPEIVWQGDVCDLIVAAREVRGVVATRWNTSGPTPRPTKTAIVSVSRAALLEADGLVREADVALVVQVCIPAVPIDATDAESPTFTDVSARTSVVEIVDEHDEGPTPEQVAQAVWATLDEDERLAVVHMGHGDRAVAAALGIGRRAGAAVAASVKDKVRSATAEGQEDTVVFLLLRWANSEDDDETAVGAEGSGSL